MIRIFLAAFSAVSIIAVVLLAWFLSVELEPLDDYKIFALVSIVTMSACVGGFVTVLVLDLIYSCSVRMQ